MKMDLKKLDLKEVIVYGLAGIVVWQMAAPLFEGLLSSLGKIGSMVLIGVGGALTYLGVQALFKKRDAQKVFDRDGMIMLGIGIATILGSLWLPSLIPGMVVLI